MYSVRVNRIAVRTPLITSAIHFFYPFNDTTYNVLLVKEVAEGNLGGVSEARRITKRAQFARLCFASTCRVPLHGINELIVHRFIEVLDGNKDKKAGPRCIRLFSKPGCPSEGSQVMGSEDNDHLIY